MKASQPDEPGNEGAASPPSQPPTERLPAGLGVIDGARYNQPLPRRLPRSRRDGPQASGTVLNHPLLGNRGQDYVGRRAGGLRFKPPTTRVKSGTRPLYPVPPAIQQRFNLQVIEAARDNHHEPVTFRHR